MKNEVYSLIYERNGVRFSMHIIADKQEAEFHADSLGLSEPEKVEAIIPSLNWNH